MSRTVRFTAPPYLGTRLRGTPGGAILRAMSLLLLLALSTTSVKSGVGTTLDRAPREGLLGAP